ncbi:nuclear transport factor 2 family protein [Flavobacterium sp. SM2513]|uniref:nuclear transport factor 2 family protein n=1 Tax=Flavobacterium sp. SM2513 TaxID=3424766 RepID=UPI003D7F4A98
MKLKKLLLPLFFISTLCYSQTDKSTQTKVNIVLDSWHQAAANADFETYFDFMSEDAVFIGTDATENWQKLEFQKYAKPHFDKGKAWNFKALERHIYLSADEKTAWFDELLDTQMKICRGSGVLIKVKNKWKIAHYVLSMSISNELSKEVIKLKTDLDDLLIEKLKR